MWKPGSIADRTKRVPNTIFKGQGGFQWEKGENKLPLLHSFLQQLNVRFSVCRKGMGCLFSGKVEQKGIYLNFEIYVEIYSDINTM